MTFGTNSGPVVVNIIGDCGSKDSRLLAAFEKVLTKLKLTDEQRQRELAYLSEQISNLHSEMETEKKSDSRQASLSIQLELEQKIADLENNGEFDQASAALNLLIGLQEKGVSKLAEDHFRAAILDDTRLAWKEGLQHYAKAYQYSPENTFYALGYMRSLAHDDNLVEAAKVVDSALARLRPIADQSVKLYGFEMALILQARAVLDVGFDHQEDAFRHLKEVNDYETKFVRASLDEFEPWVLLNLESERDRISSMEACSDSTERNNCEERDFRRTEKFYREIKKVYDPLTKQKPIYKKYVAVAALELGAAQVSVGDEAAAEKPLKEAVLLLRDLSEKAQASGKIDEKRGRLELSDPLETLSSAYFMLAEVQRHLKKNEEAEGNIKRVIEILEGPLKSKQDSSKDLAYASQILGQLYFDQKRWSESRDQYKRAISLFEMAIEEDNAVAVGLITSYGCLFEISWKISDSGLDKCDLLIKTQQAIEKAVTDFNSPYQYIERKLAVRADEVRKLGFCTSDRLRTFPEPSAEDRSDYRGESLCSIF